MREEVIASYEGILGVMENLHAPGLEGTEFRSLSALGGTTISPRFAIGTLSSKLTIECATEDGGRSVLLNPVRENHSGAFTFIADMNGTGRRDSPGQGKRRYGVWKWMTIYSLMAGCGGEVAEEFTERGGMRREHGRDSELGIMEWKGGWRQYTYLAFGEFYILFNLSYFISLFIMSMFSRESYYVL